MHTPPIDRWKGHKPLLRALIRSIVALSVIAMSSLSSSGYRRRRWLVHQWSHSITYTEGGDPVAVAPDVVITSSGTFADGYIEFGIADSESEDRLFLPEGETPDTTEDAITVIGAAVYLGSGSTYKQIGTVNSSKDGQNGRPLRVDFSAALPNSSFDDGLNGWTVNKNVLKLGALATK